MTPHLSKEPNVKYRKKPVVIEAVQWNGNNLKEMRSFIGSETLMPDWTHALPIRTLEGPLFAEINDWIIKGVKGELYPCKPDIFEATYEAVE